MIFLAPRLLAYMPMALWLFLSLIWLSRKKDAHIRSIPTGFATTGVLGTFIGIFIGLKGFSVDDISGSIPILLTGLKQSFLTSILGIILSMAFGLIIERWFRDEAEDVDINTKKLVEIVDLLKESNRNNLMMSNDLQAFQKKTIKHLFTSLKEKIETETNKLIGSLNKNNENLSMKIAEMNSKELLKAMESSADVFNTKMEDILERLIKENFDELNSTVKKMNEWQIQNMENMNELILKNTKVSKLLQDTSDILATRFEDILTHTQNLVKEEGKLQQIVTELGAVTLGNNQFKLIMQQAENSTNKLSSTIDQIDDAFNKVDNLNNNIYTTSQSLVIVTKELKELTKLKDINQEYWESLKKGNKLLNDNLDNIDEQFKESLSKTLEGLDQLIRGYLIETKTKL